VNDDPRPEGRRKGKGSGDWPEPKSRFPIVLFDDIALSVETGGLVKDLLDEGGMSMGHGETGAAKSFISVDLAAHVSLGWDWLGHRTLRRGSIYIASEGGKRIDRRLVAFKKHHAERYPATVEANGPTPLGVITTSINLLDPAADLDDLVLEINRAAATFTAPLGLIIVDTVTDALAGGDDSKSEVMNTFRRNVRLLQQRCAPPATGEPHAHLVHHPGKDPAKGDRGPYSNRAAMDTRWEVIKPAAEMAGLIHILKERDGRAGEKFGFRLQIVDLGVDLDGDPVTSCVVIPNAVPEHLAKAKKEKPLDREYQRALSFLWDVLSEVGQPLNKPRYPDLKAVSLDQWREKLKQRGMYDGSSPSRNWLGRVKKALVARKLITIDGDLVWPVPSSR
jgi:hypothetical protein